MPKQLVFLFKVVLGHICSFRQVKSQTSSFEKNRNMYRSWQISDGQYRDRNFSKYTHKTSGEVLITPSILLSVILERSGRLQTSFALGKHRERAFLWTFSMPHERSKTMKNPQKQCHIDLDTLVTLLEKNFEKIFFRKILHPNGHQFFRNFRQIFFFAKTSKICFLVC